LEIRFIGLFKHATGEYTLHITITQRLVFSITVLTVLLGNVFQKWTFLHYLASAVCADFTVLAFIRHATI
jgi:hypothetical protein